MFSAISLVTISTGKTSIKKKKSRLISCHFFPHTLKTKQQQKNQKTKTKKKKKKKKKKATLSVENTC